MQNIDDLLNILDSNKYEQGQMTKKVLKTFIYEIYQQRVLNLYENIFIN